MGSVHARHFWVSDIGFLRQGCKSDFCEASYWTASRAEVSRGLGRRKGVLPGRGRNHSEGSEITLLAVLVPSFPDSVAVGMAPTELMLYCSPAMALGQPS